MPKVTAEHIEARKRQILHAACICFAENGFGATTIQDICQRAELSTGAVYSYFDSKDDLVRALAEENMRQNEAIFSEPEPGETLAAMLRELHRTIARATDRSVEQADLDLHRMKVMLWGESLRDPQMAEVAEEAYRFATGKLTTLIAEGQHRGEANTAVDAEAAAQIVVALWEGHTLQKALEPDLDSERYLRAVEKILDGGLVPGLASTGRSAGEPCDEEGL